MGKDHGMTGLSGFLVLVVVLFKGRLLGRGNVHHSFTFAAKEIVEGQDHFELVAIRAGKIFLLGSSNARVRRNMEIINVGDGKYEKIGVESEDVGLGKSLGDHLNQQNISGGVSQLR